MATNRRNRTKGASDDKVRGDVGWRATITVAGQRQLG